MRPAPTSPGLLIKALSSADSRVRERAAGQMARMGPMKPRRLLWQAVDALSKLLHDDHKHVRFAAAQSLGFLGSKRAVPALISALKEKDRDVRERVVSSLAMLRAPEASAALLDLAVRNGDSDAAEAACELGGRTPSALADRLRAPDHARSFQAACCLARLGDRRCLPVLFKALRDGNAAIRDRAAFELGKLGDSKAAAPLISALEREREFWLRKRLVWSLSALTGRMAERGLAARLSDRDADVRDAAVEGLGKRGSRLGTRRIIEILARDGGWQSQIVTAEALGKIGDLRAVPALLKAAREPYVGAEALAALRRLITRKTVGRVSLRAIQAIAALPPALLIAQRDDREELSPAHVDCAKLRALARAELARRGARR